MEKAKTGQPLSAKINILYEGILNIMAIISGIMVGLMMFAISYSVIARYFFDSPSAWIMEVTTYLLLYISFLGAPWLLRNGGHVNVDLLLNFLNPRAKAVMNIITSLIGLLISIMLFKYGLQVTMDHFQREVVVMNVLSTPKYLLLGVIPLGSLFLIIEFARQTVLEVRKIRLS